MKKIYILSSVLLCTFASVTAQSTNTEYFVSSSYTRTNLNPALRPANGYVGFPVLTNVSLDYKTNTFNLENFIIPGISDKLDANGKKKAGFIFNKNVDYNTAMKNFSDANFLALDFNATLLGFGFYAGDMFWSFDLSARVLSDFNVPFGFFDFLKKGLQSGSTYDFKDLSISATAFAQTAIGTSFPLMDDNLMVGVKLKVLTGLGAASFNIDRFQFDMASGESKQWMLTTQGTLQVHAPGVKTKPKEGAEGEDEIDTDDIKPAISGWGLGVDLGGVFNLGYISDALENFSVSAAVTDIGGISWDKANTVTLTTNETDIMLIDGDGSIDELSFDEIGDQVKEAMKLHETKDAKNMKGMGLRSKMNIGVDYAFSSFPANVGILSTTHFNPAKTFTELTLGGSIRPFKKGLELGASYSLVYSNFQKFGVSLHLGNFLFISSDYLMPKVNSDFLPVSVKGLNVQLGIAIPLGGHKKKGSIDATPITPKSKKEKPKKEDVPPVEIPVEAPIETPVDVPVETPVNEPVEDPATVTTTTTIQY
ncbi:hypothetical protein AGMMS4957_19390 [Bacteroidia bacterium]|nr:hypothetical protein AGMMS4957_19390 [Bacteroidia bacterium]